MAETHDTHHPIAGGLYDEEQREEAQRPSPFDEQGIFPQQPELDRA